jgi:hypothetical protein
VALSHPLPDPAVRAAVQRAASAHRGARWTCTGFTSLDDRASHPRGGVPRHSFPVFAKLSAAADAAARFTAELAGRACCTTWPPARRVRAGVRAGLRE